MIVLDVVEPFTILLAYFVKVEAGRVIFLLPKVTRPTTTPTCMMFLPSAISPIVFVLFGLIIYLTQVFSGVILQRGESLR